MYTCSASQAESLTRISRSLGIEAHEYACLFNPVSFRSWHKYIDIAAGISLTDKTREEEAVLLCPGPYHPDNRRLGALDLVIIVY